MPKRSNDELHKAFAPISRRFLGQHLIEVLFWGIVAAIGQALILLLISFFIPIASLGILMVYTGVFVILFSLVVAWIIRPSAYDMVKKADKYGLQERLTTAYELRDISNEFANIQRQDALNSLMAFNPRNIPIKIPKKSSLVASIIACLLIIGFFIPNPQHRVLEQRAGTKRVLDEQLTRLEKDSHRGLSEEVGLTPEEKEEVEKLLGELSKKLKGTQEYREALKEISKTEEKLTEMIKDIRQQKLAALGKELSKEEDLKPLGEKVRDMDSEGIKEEMEKLQELAQKEEFNRELLKSIQEALEQMADEMGEGSAKDELMEIAKGLEACMGDSSIDPTDTLRALEAQLANMSENPLKSSDEVMYTLQDMKNKIAQAGNQKIDSSQLAQANPGETQNSEGNKSQNDQGDPNQSQSGQGNNGSDTSSGEGGAGNPGQGKGTGGRGQGGGQGAGIGSSHPEYEEILDPKRLGDGGETSQVKGSIGEQGLTQQIEAGQGLGRFDGFIPYNEVFGQYKSQAMQNIERINIPPNMREWVKGYFSSLE